MTPADWVAMVANDLVIFDKNSEGRVRSPSCHRAGVAVAGEVHREVTTSAGQGDVTVTTGPVRQNSQYRRYHRFCEIYRQNQYVLLVIYYSLQMIHINNAHMLFTSHYNTLTH